MTLFCCFKSFIYQASITGRCLIENMNKHAAVAQHLKKILLWLNRVWRARLCGVVQLNLLCLLGRWLVVRFHVLFISFRSISIVFSHIHICSPFVHSFPSANVTLFSFQETTTGGFCGVGGGLVDRDICLKKNARYFLCKVYLQ